MSPVKADGGEVCVVLPVCDKKELEKRVSAETRRKFGKINNTVKLNELFKNYDLFSPVPQQATLCLDTTNLSPQEAAQQIIEHYKLL